MQDRCPRCGGYVERPRWADDEPFCLMCGWREPAVASDEIDGATSAIGGDNGCEYSPRCLTCPLPECAYDMSGPEQHRAARKRRYALILAEWEQRGSAQQTAAACCVSLKTVCRALASYRSGEVEPAKRPA